MPSSFVPLPGRPHREATACGGQKAWLGAKTKPSDGEIYFNFQIRFMVQRPNCNISPQSQRIRVVVAELEPFQLEKFSSD